MTVFADLAGQEAVVAQLQATATGAAAGPGSAAMTHAWLFTGPPGSGRSLAARSFAAALQCPYGGCGDCPDCHTALGGTHADVRLVRPDGLSIGVQDTRDLVLRAALAPVGRRWQVVLIEDADRLTEGAANALLKAIEEPAARAVWLLCVPSAEDLPLTIRSRCRLVALRTPPTAAVAEVLVRRDGVDRSVAAFAARAASGHVGRARRLALDPEAARRRRDVLRVPAAVTSVAACFAAAESLVEATKEEAQQGTAPLEAEETRALREALGDGGTGRAMPRGTAGALKDLERRQRSRGTRSQRDALDRALSDLASYYRDVLTVQLGAAVQPANADLVDEIGRLAARSTPESTLRRLEATLACRTAIDASVAPLLAVEAMALVLQAG